MKYSFIAIPCIFFITNSCHGPQPTEHLLFDSLDRLPHYSVENYENFSLANEEMLVSEKEISLKGIHLLSTYSFSILSEDETICLDQPESFKKYAIAANLNYKLKSQGLEINQMLIFSKDKPGITILNFVKNVDESEKTLKLKFEANTNLSSTGWMDGINEQDGPDQINFDQVTGIFTAKDGAMDWYAVWGSSSDFTLNPASSNCREELPGFGASAGFEINLELGPLEERIIPVFIAGSDQSEYSAIETLADLRTDLFSDWEENFSLLDSLQNTSKLIVPSDNIKQIWDWSKYKGGISALNPYDQDIPQHNSDELLKLLAQFDPEYPLIIDQTAFIENLNSSRHIAPSHRLIQPLIFELLGIKADFENRVVFIKPNLPRQWNEVIIENLWMDDNKLKIAISKDENSMVVEVTQTQKSAGISIHLPEDFSKVKVLGKQVSIDTKDNFRRILMTGDHVKIEAQKN